MTPTNTKKKISFLGIALGSLIMTSLSTGNAEASRSKFRCKTQCSKVALSAHKSIYGRNDETLNTCASKCDNTQIMDVLLLNAEKLNDANKKKLAATLKGQQSTKEGERDKIESQLKEKQSQSKTKDLTKKRDKLTSEINTLRGEISKLGGAPTAETPESSYEASKPKTLGSLVDATCEDKEKLIHMHNAVMAAHNKKPYSAKEEEFILKGCKEASGEEAAAQAGPPSDLPPPLPPSDLPPKLEEAHGHQAPSQGSDDKPATTPVAPPMAPPAPSAPPAPAAPRTAPAAAPKAPARAPEGRAGLLGDLQSDNPLGRLKKSSTAPRTPLEKQGTKSVMPPKPAAQPTPTASMPKPSGANPYLGKPATAAEAGAKRLMDKAIATSPKAVEDYKSELQEALQTAKGSNNTNTINDITNRLAYLDAKAAGGAVGVPQTPIKQEVKQNPLPAKKAEGLPGVMKSAMENRRVPIADNKDKKNEEKDELDDPDAWQ